jgi:hypothetical protein
MPDTEQLYVIPGHLEDERKRQGQLTLPSVFTRYEDLSAPSSPITQETQTQQSRAQEECGGGQRGMGDEHTAGAARYGVIKAAKIGVDRQVLIIIEIQHIRIIVVKDIGQGRTGKFCPDQRLQPLSAIGTRVAVL